VCGGRGRGRGINSAAMTTTPTKERTCWSGFVKLTSPSGHESLSYLNSPGLILSAAAVLPFPPSFLPARYKCRVQSGGASLSELSISLRSSARKIAGLAGRASNDANGFGLAE